jgi:hypothetical protein
MGTAIRDPGDPLLNTWILAWDVHQLLTSPGELFEANIFYPHESTLAYSEHMFANSLIALPVIAITGKPILGYNTVFLLSFIIAGIGMYCLVLYLTGSRFAGIVSGMIFAFCPYRFDHLGHLQLLTNHWMPFVFLYLHRYFDEKKNKDLLLFTLFFVLQCLSCGYYAVFLSVSIALMLLGFMFKKRFTKKNFAGLLLFILIAGASIYPFYRPYARVHKEMNFVRSLSEVKYYSAQAKSYLSSSSSNHLYGSLNRVFGDHEKNLFPGLAAIFLSVYGFILWRKKVRGRGFYLFLLVFTFMLSLGPAFFLYKVLYEIIPPLQSVRVAARWGVMVTFSISVLAGFGARYLFEQGSSLRKRIICVLIPLILIAEYSCFPLKFHIFSKQVPAVYRWLSSRQEDFAIVELPMPSSAREVYKETRYMYWSTFHWKKLVNGYSGFFPPDYWEINGTMQKFPSEKSIALLRRLGVRYVIVHAAEFRRGRWWSAKERLSCPPLFDSSPRGGKNDGEGASGLRHVISFGTDHVYEVEMAKARGTK